MKITQTKTPSNLAYFIASLVVGVPLWVMYVGKYKFISLIWGHLFIFWSIKLIFEKHIEGKK